MGTVHPFILLCPCSHSQAFPSKYQLGWFPCKWDKADEIKPLGTSFLVLLSSNSTELWVRRPGGEPHHCPPWSWASHLNHKKPPVPSCKMQMALTPYKIWQINVQLDRKAFVDYRCLRPWIPLFPTNPNQQHPECRGFSFILEAGQKKNKRDDNSAPISSQ